MKRRMVYSFLVMFFLCILFLVPPVSPSKATPSLPPSQAQIENILQDQSSFFTENKGQWDPEILFMGDTSFGKVAFAREAVYYQLIKVTETEESMEKEPQGREEVTRLTSFPDRKLPHGIREKNERIYESQVVKLSFVEGKGLVIRGVNPLSHYHNYFIGNNPNKWASYCKNYTKVYYEDIWEGIDLAYFFTEEGMKYEYYVEPEADIQKLQVRVEGAEILNQGNALQVITKLGNIQDTKLKVFEEKTNRTFLSKFVVHDCIYSFQGIPEIRRNTIVIDPLVYSTYLGGSGDNDPIFSDGESVSAIAVDSSGNAYITGNTTSSDFPITSGAYQKTLKGEHDEFVRDVFITKLNSNGSDLLYSTYLGGSSDYDFTYAMAVDESGNAYIAGRTDSSDFPITSGAYQKKFKGDDEAFVTKLNSNGSALLYSTYLGGSDGDSAYSITVDESGNAYIAGRTDSSDFPITSGAYQKTNKKNDVDAFITKLEPNGSSLLYSTYLGGSGWDFTHAIAVDESGNAYITGDTTSSDFPITSGAYQKKFKGDDEAFVTKLNSNGSALLYSTYLGGSSGNDDPLFGYGDSAYSITVDALGNAYIAGFTDSSDFPITSGAYQKTLKGEYDAFATKLNPNGSSLLYSTYLGGSDYDNLFFTYGDSASAIAVDSSGNAYIAGYTGSSDFPITSDAYQKANMGGNDAFATKLNSNGSALLYSTYLGGSDNDYAHAMAVDASGNAYIAGGTGSSDFPITSDAYQKTNKGEYINAFITKLSLRSNDTTSPVIIIDYPPNNFITNTYSVILQGKVLDEESGIESLTIDDSPRSFSSDGSFNCKIEFLQEGDNKFVITATNFASLSTTYELHVNRDTFPPAIVSLELDGIDLIRDKQKIDIPETIWVKNSKPTIKGTVEESGSGIQEVILSVGGEAIKTEIDSDGSFIIPLELQDNEPSEVKLSVIDKAGNQSQEIKFQVSSDLLPPNFINLLLDNTTVFDNKEKMEIPEIIWVKNSKPTIKGTVEESGSGIQEVILSVGGEAIKTKIDSDGSFIIPLELQDNEPSEVKLSVIDKAGNQSQEIKFQVGSDLVPPNLINLFIDNTTILNNQEKMDIPETIWVKSSKPTIKGTVEDGGSGIQEILCTKNNVPVLVYLADDNTFHIPLVLEKETEIRLTLTDKAGNSKEFFLKVNIDFTVPRITLPKSLDDLDELVYTDQYSLQFEASDTGSGLASVLLTDMDGTSLPFMVNGSRYQASLPLQKGGNLFTITAIDNAGNETKQNIQLRYQPAVVITLTIGNSVATVQKNKDIKPVVMKVSPMIVKGTTFVPIRFIAETFGARVEWIPYPTNEIQIYFKEILIHLWIHKTIGVVERGTETKKVTLLAAPFITNSTTMVPLRFISENLDAQVVWDAPTSTITIVQAVE